MPIDWTKTCVACQYCCSYVSLEIDAPKKDGDYDVIRWYLAHKQIDIYLDEDDCWYFLVNTPCENLAPEGCRIYEDRFQICRDYSASACEMTRGVPGEKILFRTVEDFDRWVEFNGRKKKAKAARRKAPKKATTITGRLSGRNGSAVPQPVDR